VFGKGRGGSVTRQISYTVQIGTDFDYGQKLFWTLAAEKFLQAHNVFATRPRFYRKMWADLAARYDGTPAGADALNAMFHLDRADPDADLHFVLKVTELMQPAQHFCPAGDWLFDLGARAARYRGVLAPSPVTFMISLRNPAIMLSEAWASGDYPGFDVLPPDPFRLSWPSVLRDLRQQCPDAAIIAWTAEESPIVWGRVLKAAAGLDADFSIPSQIHIARRLMSEEGAERLEKYLESHPGMPEDLRTRVITIFLKRFAREDAVEADIVIPGWTEALQDQIDDRYAADLEEVRGIEGVTLIST